MEIYQKGVISIENDNEVYEIIILDDQTLADKIRYYENMIKEKKENLDLQLQLNDQYNYLGLKIARLMYIFVTEEYNNLKQEAEKRGLSTN